MSISWADLDAINGALQGQGIKPINIGTAPQQKPRINGINVELTRFTKVNGPLTKRIALTSDGNVKSDGSACVMAQGTAQRLLIADIGELAAVIEKTRSDQAIALGALRPGLPDSVHIVTKQKLNGQANTIARTVADINYRKGETAVALFDFDTKGIPPEVAAEMQRRGGFWASLLSVLPPLQSVGHVIRRSTSAGLFRSDTGQKLPGSNGLHVYVVVQDGADVERFVRAVHERCWLAGLGWMIVGAGGQLLDRSIVDRMVGRPERLVFEGDPILDPPLAQDRESRRPTAVDGAALDSIAACPPLSIVETAKLRALKAKEKHRLTPESAKARAAFIAAHAKRLAERTGLSEAAAAEQISRQCDGILHPCIELAFDDEEFAGCTVGDVLADPERFEGATLADPLEGVDYDRGVAKIMRREDGSPWIHSFAHGRTIYELKHNTGSVRAAMEAVADDAVVKTFVKLVLVSDLSDDEVEQLRNEVAKRSKVNKRTVSQMLKEAREKQAAKRRQQERDRRIAERNDPRPRIRVPDNDAEWIPVMDVLNEVIGASPAPHPMVRDIDGFVAYTSKVVMPEMHLFTTDTANAEQEERDHSLPPPEQWLIRRMDEISLAEAIERHIEFVDDGRSVHLPGAFVKHYLRRDDDALPTVVAVSTLPLVLGDGQVLGGDKFDRLRGIDFHVQPELAGCVPEPRTVSDEQIERAMRLLTDDWLVDVATDYEGKCKIVAATLTLIERSLLDQRPAFFVTAGRRGGGKTTTLIMLIKAITGIHPAAAAWSTNEEEQRKALLSYFMYGAPYILWDNIARGTKITCPHIEKSCTAAYYIDRKLGVSETVATAASTIHFFTGNNIAPGGDLASRSQGIRLELDRYDPENREFKHPDPIDWTDRNRAEILRALYTILLGNPTLRKSRNAPMKTRFKRWYRLVGSAVEHAAHLVIDRMEPGTYGDDHLPRPCEVDFLKLFLASDDEDEDSTALGEVLAIMRYKWPVSFDVNKIAGLINDPGKKLQDAHFSATLREFFYPGMPTSHVAASRSIGQLLKNHMDEPVRRGDLTLILRGYTDPGTNQLRYRVEKKGENNA